MNQMNQAVTPQRYDAVAQILHWVMALILLYQIFFSEFEHMTSAAKANEVQLHAGLGMIVLVLGILRLIWRFARPRPAPLPGPKWQVRAGEWTHWLFYILFVLTPLSGIVLAGSVDYPVRVFGGPEISEILADDAKRAMSVRAVHGLMANIIMVLFFLHVLAALYHQFVVRDGALLRMAPPHGKRG